MRILLGPTLAIIAGILCHFGGQPYAISVTVAVTVLCMVWWVMESIPVPVTAIIPMAVFPLTGVLNASQVAAAYGSQLILLLMGGFILSKALEANNAHKKLALVALNTLGYQNPRRMVLSFMCVTALLSMWISNTATVLMMLPIVLVILEKIDNPQLRVPLLLGLAYSASIGGMGTPVGTPPNLVMMSVYEENNGSTISFLSWMSWSLPVVIILIPVAAWWLVRKLDSGQNLGVDLSEFHEPWSPAIKRVLIVFGFTALGWITRTAPFGGWGQFVPTANDASVAFIAVIALFLIGNAKGGKLLNWSQATEIPWGVLILFAGGITLAKAFQSSGLSELLGQTIGAAGQLPILLVLLFIALGVSFLTETTSNTASTVLLMPILAAAASINQMPLELLMFPAALSASCAFMMPVATAPNIVVYGAKINDVQQITIRRMMKEGVVLNIVAALIITCVSYAIFT